MYGNGIRVNWAESGVTISAGSRLHLGLVDMGNATGRAFGGLGCMLEAPRVAVRAVLADASSVTIGAGNGLDRSPSEAELRAETELLRRFVARFKLSPVRVSVVKRLPRHVGLGSGTSTCLAILTSAALANNIEADRIPIRDIQRLSLRGRTSGIGIHGFFEGGWIVDAGQPAGSPLVPSAANRSREPSLLVQRIHAPANWTVHLFRPSGKQLSGSSEVKFFERNTPIPQPEVHAGLALLYHGMVPALITQDLSKFGAALSEFQQLGFKNREIGAQPVRVRQLMEDLRKVSPCVGMSSMGPQVFSIGGDAEACKHIAARFDCNMEITRISNSGWWFDG